MQWTKNLRISPACHLSVLPLSGDLSQSCDRDSRSVGGTDGNNTALKRECRSWFAEVTGVALAPSTWSLTHQVIKSLSVELPSHSWEFL